MSVNVRLMTIDEVNLIIDYFHSASAEHLELLGVDPTRLPDRKTWLKIFEHDYSQPIEQRRSVAVIWELDGQAIGFSSVDKIRYGKEAYMHLHVVEPGLRQKGFGSECVSRSVRIYFEALKLECLYCEPNAFNVGPNRALQKAGFRYIKTHKTVPGPLNFHQAVTRWALDRTVQVNSQ